MTLNPTNVITVNQNFSARINELGPKPMDDLLLRLGDWTGLQDLSWNEEQQFNWDDYMITLNRNGLQNDFILSVELDVEKLNSTSATIEVGFAARARELLAITHPVRRFPCRGWRSPRKLRIRRGTWN